MSDVLARPTPGYRYSVIQGDTLWDISIAAYGTPFNWQKIKNANGFLNGRPPVSDGSPVIYTGDILIIPDLSIQDRPLEEPDKVLTGRADDDLTLLINDREIKYEPANIIRTMDTAADGGTCTLAWTPGADKELDRLLLPFQYPKAEIFIGNNKILTGRVYAVAPTLRDGSRQIVLEIYSRTADAVDSTVEPPYEKNNITLESRADDLLLPLGMRAVFDIDSGGAFDRMTASVSNAIFDHLAEYAAQRGILVSCTPKGELFFYRADVDAAPVGTLTEGENFALEFAAKYDGRKLFHTYKAYADTPGGDAQSNTAVDDNVPVSRSYTFVANDTTDGNINRAAEWKRSKKYADALTIPMPVSGWKAPNGDIWEPNTTVILKSESLFLPAGHKMMVRTVQYELSAGGRSAVLGLVPLEVYTGDPVQYIWSIR